MTKAERQAQLAKQQMESALVSLTRNDSFGREDIDEDVEEVSDDDDVDSFSGQFMVKVDWKLDIFRLPVFPVGLTNGFNLLVEGGSGYGTTLDEVHKIYWASFMFVRKLVQRPLHTYSPSFTVHLLFGYRSLLPVRISYDYVSPQGSIRTRGPRKRPKKVGIGKSGLGS